MFEKEAIEKANKKYPITKVCNEIDVARNRKYEEGFKDGAEFGYEQGIGRLRYCCTCKKWKECGVESMYGICADWEIKGE